ncbi:STAS/SEC14 domain-containing protein [Synoicihabitans lomoniglobus]|uniref:STAS/SEC14 domain-containing protein n=1 Tax=Synoicihabitans lomoniglobus TaxID=2909285 RepID=A0AAF0I5I9_9BACT|nr:STAS/SEC14 domain-containing protein [Opitutaceae bacterium LMO-M01]WED67304.1 STAS/SEC14 domain-containing protein [Opitutaceae bacterium LMO-M01]
MHSITRTDSDRLAILLQGKFDADEMDDVLSVFVTKSVGMQDGKLLIHANDYQMPTFEAMRLELSRLSELMPVIHRFSRVAVIAEKAWVRKMSEWEGAVIPDLEIKAFEPTATVDAENWLGARESSPSQ